AGEALAEEDPDVFVAGPAGQLADRLVAETAVERRRLIAVRVEVHLMAAAAYCLGLGRGDQARAEPVPSKRAVDPDRLHEPRAAPGPPVQARNDRSLVVAHENGERAPVVDTGRRGVELVEPVVEDRDVPAARLILDPDLFGHPQRRFVATPRGPRRHRARARGSSPPSA